MMGVIVIQRKHTDTKKKRKLCLSTKRRVDKATEKCLRIAAWWRTLNTAHAAEAARKQKDEVRGREKKKGKKRQVFSVLCASPACLLRLSY